MIYEGYAIFTPGPVKMSENILEIGSKQTPYFRNKPFSEVLIRSEKLLLKMLNAPKGSRVVFLTASGTAGLESVVMNLLDKNDQALIINGGGFGQRFVDICKSHTVSYDEYRLKGGDLADIEDRIDAGDSNTLLVNAHETSVGHLYNLEAIGKFCKKNNLFSIVDAISMFVTDELDMQKHYIDTVILSSQKGLALPPGLTMVALTPQALKKVRDIESHYFNFKNYLKDGERGQTPYTPAVTIILQLLERLEQIESDGGIAATIKHAQRIALYFREAIRGLPLDFFTPYMPNAMTTLIPTDGRSAIEIVQALEDRYRVVVCPNGGELRDKIFRVSHMGEMTQEYTDILIEALHDLYSKGNR